MNNYYIKKDYQANNTSLALAHRNNSSFWEDKKNLAASAKAQFYIYRMAYRLALKNHIRKVLDIGCGIAKQLNAFFGKEFDIYGVDQKPAIEHCKTLYQRGTYVADDIHSPAYPLKSLVNKIPLIISADVIEHLADPDSLLRYIKCFADPKTLIVISTPERDAFRGKKATMTPNPYHVREWNYDEFHRYIASKNFEILEHTTMFSDKIGFDFATLRRLASPVLKGRPLKHTQVIVARLKEETTTRGHSH